jgi:NDP-sugar pyrophosphorylase family protein
VTETIDGFILAAGLGTRMGPLSRVLPKPAWPFNGRPLIALAADGLRRAGIRNLACNAHSLPDQIEEATRGTGIEVFREPVLQGTAGGLRHVRDRAGDELAVWNGDILAEPPWAALRERHRALGSDLSWLLIPHPGGPWNPVWLSPDGRILPPGETGEGPYHFVGPAFWGRKALALLPDDGPADVKALILPRVKAFGVVVDPFPFFEIGSPDQLIEAAAQVAPRAEGRVPGWKPPPLRPGSRGPAPPRLPGSGCVLVPGRGPPCAPRAIDWNDERATSERP